MSLLSPSPDFHNPPAYLADYRRVPLPSLPVVPNLHSCGTPAPSQPFLNEWEAPLVYGALSHKQYHRSFLFRSLGFSVYPSAVRVHRNPELVPKQSRSQIGKKKSIDGFSVKSRRKLRFTATNSFPALTSQIVLTYPAEFPQDGKESKKHISVFLNNFRHKYKGVPYLWVLEFQKRGAPHYHFFTSLPVTEENHLWLARTWVRIACDDREDAFNFHTHSKNMIPWNMGNGAYVCKYIEKENQKDVPEGYINVGRFWGASRGLVPDPIFLDAEEMSAAYVDHIIKPVTRMVRALCRYHENVTTWWGRDENGTFIKKGKSRVRSATSFYNFTIINAKKIFVQVTKYYDRNERGRISFKEWSCQLLTV